MSTVIWIAGNLLYAGSSGQTNITESDFGTVSVMEIIVCILLNRYLIERIVSVKYISNFGVFLIFFSRPFVRKFHLFHSGPKAWSLLYWEDSQCLLEGRSSSLQQIGFCSSADDFRPQQLCTYRDRRKTNRG